MSIVLITGNHPRHKYFAETLAKTGLVSGWIQEIREPFIPSAPEGLSEEVTQLFNHHFSERDRVENDFFGHVKSIDVKTIDVTLDELNSEKSKNFIQSLEPKLIISYGCHKLDTDYLNFNKAVFWNTHGGLSPQYRGTITHFWPSYFLEPQMTGMTLHETTTHIDGGGIIHQTAAPMVKGDTLHMLAARTVKDYANNIANKLQKLDFNNLPIGLKQKSTGKIFMNADWRPEHLLTIYKHHNDKIVDKLLNGEIEGKEPKLVTCL